MIRRLRWKFVLINMSVVLAIMFTLCAVLFATTRDSLRRDSLAALEQAVTLTNTNTPSFSFRIDPEQNDNETYALFGSERVQLPFFTVQTSGSSTIFVLANQFFDTSDQDTLLAVVHDALEAPAQTGTIHEGGYSLRFLRANSMFGYRIAYVDLTQSRARWQRWGAIWFLSVWVRWLCSSLSA